MGERRTGWLRKLGIDRPEASAWALYDCANSAFWLTIVTTVFPIYYKQLVGADLDPDAAQQRFAETTRDSLIVIALLAPFLGALADVRASRKRFLAFFVLVGVGASGGMFFLLPGDWEAALVLFALANIGAAGSVVFYDALLPHVAGPNEMDRLSTTGFALGYLGSGLLLALNVVWMARPDWFALPHGEGLSIEQSTLPKRLSFLSVALWWAVFTLPLLRRVKEPPGIRVEGASGGSTFGAALGQLARTFKELRSFGEAGKMLLAFLIYNDGIVTLIRMAALYAVLLGLDEVWVLASILVLQFVGVPFSLLFGTLGQRFGPRRMIFAGVAVYTVISAVAYFMSTNWHFVVLAMLVGTVQGGTQGLSRSLFASMIPKHKSGEFFALFAVGEKFAGIFGPMTFALVISITGTARNAILSVLAFFVVGALVLTRVDVEKGRRQAREAEQGAA